MLLFHQTQLELKQYAHIQTTSCLVPLILAMRFGRVERREFQTSARFVKIGLRQRRNHRPNAGLCAQRDQKLELRFPIICGNMRQQQQQQQQ